MTHPTIVCTSLSGLVRLSLLAGVLAGLLLLSATLPCARASAKPQSLAITSPAKSAKVKGRMKVTVRASRAYKRVRFGLDRRHLWLDRKYPFKFRKTAYLDTSRLKRGKHRLWVAGRRRNGDLNRVSRVFYVQREKRTSRPPGGPTLPPPAPSPPSPTPSPPPSPPLAPFGGMVLFRGDFNTGDTSQFRVVQSAPGRVTVGTSDPAPFEGSHRGRFEVRAGDSAANGNRAEVTGPDMLEGSERWIRQAIYVPTGSATEPGWRLVAQVHSFGGGSPPLALFLDAGASPSFKLGHGDSSTFDWNGPTIQRNRWYDVVLHVRFSPASSTGFVEVYLDGRLQTLTNGQTRRYRATSASGGGYYKTGIYRSSSIGQTDVIYHDNVVIAAP